MKELFKSFEIFLNFGLRNFGRVKVLNLICKYDLYGFLVVFFCCVKVYNKFVENKNDSLIIKVLIIIDMIGFNFRLKSVGMYVLWFFLIIILD